MFHPAHIQIVDVLHLAVAPQLARRQLFAAKGNSSKFNELSE
jgi:hypothetical protein